MRGSEFRETSPSSDPLDDAFILNLIEAVQRNPCVYNRYDPLHKITDYKHEVWRLIATETEFDGQPVELERKWRHMRDKYVRLRKQDKLQAPIRKSNKWYNYFQKMSFLDPYVEHRNRKNRKDGENKSDDEDFDQNHIEITNSDAFNQLYESLLLKSGPISDSGSSAENPTENPAENELGLGLVEPSLMLQNIPKSEPRKRKRAQVSGGDSNFEPPQNFEEEDEVSLFVRSIAKSLAAMDKRTFSKTRIEISKVLYDCQFGNEA